MFMQLHIAPQQKRGVTLVELLVVIGIIGVVMGIAIPAVLRAREASRQVKCKDHLRQIALAVQNYEGANRRLPRSHFPKPLKVALLPYLELGSLHDALIPLNTMNDALESSKRYPTPAVYLCPSDSAGSRPDRDGVWASNYVGNAGTGYTRAGFDGLFGSWMGVISLREIVDGTSNTALISECLVFGRDTTERRRLLYFLPVGYPEASEFPELMNAIATAHQWGALHNHLDGRGRPWTEGNDPYTLYHHALGPNSNSGYNRGSNVGGLYSTASDHAALVNLAFVDGSVTSISNEITPEVWWAMGSRAGREILARNE